MQRPRLWRPGWPRTTARAWAGSPGLVWGCEGGSLQPIFRPAQYKTHTHCVNTLFFGHRSRRVNTSMRGGVEKMAAGPGRLRSPRAVALRAGRPGPGLRLLATRAGSVFPQTARAGRGAPEAPYEWRGVLKAAWTAPSPFWDPSPPLRWLPAACLPGECGRRRAGGEGRRSGRAGRPAPRPAL